MLYSSASALGPGGEYTRYRILKKHAQLMQHKFKHSNSLRDQRKRNKGKKNENDRKIHKKIHFVFA